MDKNFKAIQSQCHMKENIYPFPMDKPVWEWCSLSPRVLLLSSIELCQSDRQGSNIDITLELTDRCLDNLKYGANGQNLAV